MWNYSFHLDADSEFIKKIVKYSKISGTVLMILGLIGIFFPVFTSFSTSIFVSGLMIFSGVSIVYFTWTTNKSDWAGWLKAFALIGVGILMIIYPLSGVATIGLLLAFYFFMDAFAGFGLAFSIKPNNSWWVWLLNAVLSLILGFILLIGWPLSSLYLVGFFVGFSLFFDGFALLIGGNILDKMDK